MLHTTMATAQHYMKGCVPAYDPTFDPTCDPPVSTAIFFFCTALQVLLHPVIFCYMVVKGMF